MTSPLTGNPAQLEPVSLDTAPNVIVGRLRDAIRDGIFAPGEQLLEERLSGELGVSRGPVREALQRLVQEGLAHNKRHRGTFVVDLKGLDITDIYLTREAIEGMASLVIMRTGDTDALDALAMIIEDMTNAAATDDWEALSALDLKFHDALVKAAGSTRLDRMFSTLLVETRMCLRNLRPAYADHHDLVEEHRSLLGALLSGDEERALGLLRDHMASAIKVLGGISAIKQDVNETS